MNIKQSLYKNDTKVSRLYKDGCLSLASIGSDPAFSSLDDFASINKYWKYKISEDSEIVSSLDDAVKDYAYLTTDKKWYVKNNVDQYEEYGVYGNSIDETTEEDVCYGVFDGASYFDTGIQAQNNIKVEFKFANVNTDGMIIGSRISAVTYALNTLPSVVGSYLVDLGNERNTISGQAQMFAAATGIVEMWAYDADGSNTNVETRYNIYKDGSLVYQKTSGTTSIGINKTSSGNGLNMYIGAMNNNGAINFYAKANIYYIKIYTDIDVDGNGTLAHHFIFKEVDGVGKMYDTITDTYYDNKGTGAITVVEKKEYKNTKYVGKLAVVNDHEYKWNGTEWVDLGEMITINNYAISSSSVKFEGYKSYWNNGYHMEIDYYLNDTISYTELLLFGPFEFVFYMGGFYLDVHKPTSTAYLSFDSGDYTYRVGPYKNASYIKKDRTKQKVVMGYDDIAFYNYGESTALWSGGSSITNSWYAGEYNINYLGKAAYIMSSHKDLYIFGLKFYNASNELIHDFVIRSHNNTLTYDDMYLLDKVTGTTYENTLTTTPVIEVATQDTAYPESYPDRPTPSSSVTETSYHNFLADDYYNGQTVKVYKKYYNVIDGEMEEPVEETPED